MFVAAGGRAQGQDDSLGVAGIILHDGTRVTLPEENPIFPGGGSLSLGAGSPAETGSLGGGGASR